MAPRLEKRQSRLPLLLLGFAVLSGCSFLVALQSTRSARAEREPLLFHSVDTAQPVASSAVDAAVTVAAAAHVVAAAAAAAADVADAAAAAATAAAAAAAVSPASSAPIAPAQCFPDADAEYDGAGVAIWGSNNLVSGAPSG